MDKMTLKYLIISISFWANIQGVSAFKTDTIINNIHIRLNPKNAHADSVKVVYSIQNLSNENIYEPKNYFLLQYIEAVRK